MPFATEIWSPTPTVLRSQGHDVQVWWIEVPYWRPHVATLRQFLSPDERARADRFRFEADAHRLIIGRGILRMFIGEFLHAPPDQVDFVYSATGKPSVGGIEFNVAHSGDVILIATHDCPVGVDVERIDREVDVTAMSRICFTARERGVLMEHHAPQEAFFRLWTRKEAWLKAVGTGLSFRPGDIDVTDAAAPSISSSAVVDGPQPSLILDLPAKRDYVAACAISGPVCRVRLWHLQ